MVQRMIDCFATFILPKTGMKESEMESVHQLKNSTAFAMFSTPGNGASLGLVLNLSDWQKRQSFFAAAISLGDLNSCKRC